MPLTDVAVTERFECSDCVLLVDPADPGTEVSRSKDDVRGWLDIVRASSTTRGCAAGGDAMTWAKRPADELEPLPVASP